MKKTILVVNTFAMVILCYLMRKRENILVQIRTDIFEFDPSYRRVKFLLSVCLSLCLYVITPESC